MSTVVMGTIEREVEIQKLFVDVKMHTFSCFPFNLSRADAKNDPIVKFVGKIQCKCNTTEAMQRS